MTTDLVSAAEEYLNAGLSIIALAGKHPNGSVHRHGLNEPISGAVRGHANHWGYDFDDDCAGCRDTRLIEQAFDHRDTTGVGIVLPDYLVVVDIDGEEGAKAFRELVPDDDDWTDAPAASTGRGLHLYYLSGRPRRTTKLADKLDLKGAGGYVAAPPSLHPSGVIYAWGNTRLVSGNSLNVGFLPDAIEHLLNKREEWRLELHPDNVPVLDYRLNGTILEPYDAYDLEKSVAMVRAAKPGDRNNALNAAAYVAALHGIPIAEAQPALYEAAIAAGLDSREARLTIRSAYRSKHV